MVRVITFNNRPDLYSPLYKDMISMSLQKHLTTPYEHLHVTSEKGDSWRCSS